MIVKDSFAELPINVHLNTCPGDEIHSLRPPDIEIGLLHNTLKKKKNTK